MKAKIWLRPYLLAQQVDYHDSIVSKAGDTFNNINLNFDANGLLQEGGNFFSNIWNAIVNFFKGLFGG